VDSSQQVKKPGRNGNVTQLFDLSDGSEEGHYEYDPFGKEIVASGNQSEWNKFRFSTKYLEDVVIDASKESELGLYYYGYRYYSPRLGRWITRDPIAEHGGINLYQFNKNSPIIFIDGLGNSIWKRCDECKPGELKDCKVYGPLISPYLPEHKMLIEAAKKIQGIFKSPPVSLEDLVIGGAYELGTKDALPSYLEIISKWIENSGENYLLIVWECKECIQKRFLFSRYWSWESKPKVKYYQCPGELSDEGPYYSDITQMGPMPVCKCLEKFKALNKGKCK